MRILPKVSDGTISPEGLPNEKTTEVETDVMMCSGQGMLIGGLIQETDSNIQTKIPYLGSVPYLGVLFQKRTVLKTRREIIITLEPHVMPFDPVEQSHHDEQIARANDPLTYGAIHSFPRPYEPKMVDALQPHAHKQYESHWDKEPVHPVQLEALPPVEASDLQNPAAIGVAVPRKDNQLRRADFEAHADPSRPQLTR
jgi:hypothetical protein